MKNEHISAEIVAGGDARKQKWALALYAGALLAIDPRGLAGAVIRSAPSPALDCWLAAFRALTPSDAPWRKVPARIAPARLVGGLDLSASLVAGKPIFESGLLAEADGGVIVAAMGERIEADIAAILSSALDDGVVRAERDGFSRIEQARFAFLVIDEGCGPDEGAPERLADRVAFAIDLDGVSVADAIGASVDRNTIEVATARLAGVSISVAQAKSLNEAGLRFGAPSLRALRFALAAARASAALEGRMQATDEDVAVAAALVYGSRAIYSGADAKDNDASAPPEGDGDAEDAPTAENSGPLQDRIVAAVKAAVDASLLAGAAAGGARQRLTAGKSGASRKSLKSGRAYASRRGDPSRGGRLVLIDTLRAAAPWQKIRGRTDASQPLAIRRDDLRIARFRQREQSLTIFVVDASGSAAMQRLGETKGAIEHLFAQSYCRRDEVALIAFRRTGADLLVPPTRSLVRARRLLAELPGGGGTPLAAGINAALALSDLAAARGRTPTIVMLTDGRANVALNGEGGRDAARRDAIAAAKRLKQTGRRVLVFDTSLRPEPLAEEISMELGAAYRRLPQSDPRLMAAAIASGRVPR